eukprot:10511261-Ditylum_brightwellii.AAC.1
MDTLDGSYQMTDFNCGLDMARPKAIQIRCNHCNQRASDYSQHSAFYYNTSNCMKVGSYTTVMIAH